MTLLKILLNFGLLIELSFGRPSEIFFKDENVSLLTSECDIVAGEIFWKDDGKCYTIGQRGPCNENEILSVSSKRIPECSPTTVSIKKTVPLLSKSTAVEIDSNNVTGTDQCDGDTIAWSDGKCYQLASTGPCPSGQWLVLDSIVNGEPGATCQDRKCVAEHVWWAENCTCVSLHSGDGGDVKLKTGLESPCAEGEIILITPYGNGICGVPDSEELSVRLFERIPDNFATKGNCILDETGKCRILTWRNRGKREAESDDDSNQSQELIDLITWLEQFKKPDDDLCAETDTANVGIAVDDFIDIAIKNATEEECHREGKVLFENGGCYNLLERGPCFEQSMWLVMVLQGDGSLKAECQPRRCPETGDVWNPETCSCEDPVSGPGARSCGQAETLLVDVFGQGVCGCQWGEDTDQQFMRWDQDGVCYNLGSQGPCQPGQFYAPDPESGDAVCKDDGDTTEDTTPTSRVFDIIPSGSNSINHNTSNMVKITQQTCVLDARGKCRRKLAIKRDAGQSSASSFKIWLQSFQKRAPINFTCEE